MNNRAAEISGKTCKGFLSEGESPLRFLKDSEGRMEDFVKKRILELEEKKHLLMKAKNECGNILKYRAILDSIKKVEDALEYNRGLLAKLSDGGAA